MSRSSGFRRAGGSVITRCTRPRRQQRVERARALAPDREHVHHQAVGAVVRALDRHAQREGQRLVDRGAAVDQGVELAVARGRGLVVVRAVAVVGDQPDEARLAAQHLVDGRARRLRPGRCRPAPRRPACCAVSQAGQRGLHVGVHGRRRRPVRTAAPRGDGAPGSDWLKAASTSASPGCDDAADQRRHQRLEGRLRVAVERLHPAGVLHQEDLRDRERAARRSAEHASSEQPPAVRRSEDGAPHVSASRCQPRIWFQSGWCSHRRLA